VTALFIPYFPQHKKFQQNMKASPHMKHQPSLISVAVALTFLPLFVTSSATAMAQNTTEGKAESYTVVAAQSLPTVTVTDSADSGYAANKSSGATKSSAPLRDVPQTVNVIPKQLMTDQGARSMQDVLRNVPGISMSSGDGQRDQVTIRGFSAIADQFIDGVRDDSLYFRDLSNIERVEVLKGPAAVLYGRGSSGGLINRVTKKPARKSFGELSFTAGSNRLQRMTVDANAGLGEGAALRVTGAYEDSNTFRDQGFLERSSIAPSISVDLASATKLLVQGNYSKDRRITDFGIPSFNGRPVDVPRETYYGSGNAARDDYTATEVSSLNAILDHRFSETFSVRNIARYYTYDLDRNNTLPGGTVDAATQTIGRNRGNIHRQEDGYFNQTDFTLKADWGSIKQEILFGAEVGKQNKFQQFANQANIDRVSIFNPGGVVAPPISAATLNGAAAIPANSTFDVLGVYVQDQIAFTPQVKALVGVRYDTFEQNTEFARTLAPLAREDKTWSPRAGVVWQPNDVTSFYVSYSKSFQPSGESFALAANNAQNKPEKTENNEIGTKLDLFDGRFSVTASLFNLERSEIKTTDPANPTVLINVGKQRTRGLELTANGRLSFGIELAAGYAFLDGLIVESNSTQAAPQVANLQTPAQQIRLQGNRPSLTPKHSGFIWATVPLRAGFSAGGGLNYSADRFASPSNAVVLPGFVTADLAAYYRSKKFDVALNLKNATNKKYIAAGHGGNDNLLLPGAPRELQMTVAIKF
jgi:catecholate siderophore receptor